MVIFHSYVKLPEGTHPPVIKHGLFLFHWFSACAEACTCTAVAEHIGITEVGRSGSPINKFIIIPLFPIVFPWFMIYVFFISRRNPGTLGTHKIAGNGMFIRPVARSSLCVEKSRCKPESWRKMRATSPGTLSPKTGNWCRRSCRWSHWKFHGKFCRWWENPIVFGTY